jgi:carbamoyltransferase
MSYSLGIHIGHDASCAVVNDGCLVAAVTQERFTRRKYDGEHALSNRLPVKACLDAANLTLDNISIIVSSFQSAAPGGVGLQYPLVEPSFSLFDPNDKRHFVASHHLAHAFSAFGCSGFEQAAILVCDHAGSSTIDGKDYFLPFSEWSKQIVSSESPQKVLSECLSIYNINLGNAILKHREFGIPHNQTEIFIQNVASLYDNVSRFVFEKENAYGQLMALASYHQVFSSGNINSIDSIDLIDFNSDTSINFRNDWQHKVTYESKPENHSDLAFACQRSLEEVLLAYAKQAFNLTHSPNLAVAGGVFLNILANSKILQSGLFKEYYVPSAPHDAGISVGCAFWGDLQCHARKSFRGKKVLNDRLGVIYKHDLITKEIERKKFFIHCDKASISQVANLIYEGKIIARFSGRAEFGPRALGGRSILGSPLSEKTKERLNKIKGRQGWRPVAPIVLAERISDYFSGPVETPFMTYSHVIKEEFVKKFTALSHPDSSSRVQTIVRNVDPWLYDLLLEFEDLSGFPVIVNTSLNTAGQPIVETPSQALELFLRCPDIDAILLDSLFVTRQNPLDSNKFLNSRFNLVSDCFLTSFFTQGIRQTLITRGHISEKISTELSDHLMKSYDKVKDFIEAVGGLDSNLMSEFTNLIFKGFFEINNDSFELV